MPLPDFENVEKDRKYMIQPLEAVEGTNNRYVARLIILNVQPTDEMYEYSLKVTHRDADSVDEFSNILAFADYR